MNSCEICGGTERVKQCKSRLRLICVKHWVLNKNGYFSHRDYTDESQILYDPLHEKND